MTNQSTQFQKGHIVWNKNLKGVIKRSEETKQKMSDAKRGHIVSEETKNKMSEAHKGKFIGKKSPCWKEDKKPKSIRRVYSYQARQKLKNLGYNITGKEVHHIDRNWRNNNIKNLQILSTPEHTKLHWKQGDIRGEKICQ